MLGELLAVFADHLGRRLRPERRAHLEKLAGVGHKVLATPRCEPGQDLTVDVCRGRRLEVERVGDDSRGHAQGHRLVGLEPGPAKLPGYERAGRAYRLVHESDRLRALEPAAQPVMVEHLHDFRLVGPRHRLGQLVVIHEHQPGPRRIEDVALEGQPHQHAVVADHRKHRLGRPLDRTADFRRRCLRGQRENICLHHRVDELRRLEPERRVDRVERAQDHRHLAGSGQLHEPLGKLEPARDHERPYAVLDRRQLDRRPVTADHDQAPGRIALHPGCEPLSTHRAHHHQQLVPLARLERMLKRAVEHAAHRL